MRSDKELIQLILDGYTEYYNNHAEEGICIYAEFYLLKNDFLTQEEMKKVIDIIWKHKPEDAGPRYFWGWGQEGFEKRMEFLRELLKIYSA